MKKRIISLILVVVMAFLTLTGCAYNYAKDDMTKYATLDADAFFKYLHEELKIVDGDFGTDEEVRMVKVQDAIAAAILKITDTADKKYEGKLNNYDALYYCYYATDDMGNVFFASKMDESSPSNLQIGLSTLEGLNKLISDGALSLEDVKNHLYSTSSAAVVNDGDVISLSYVKTWKNGDEDEKDEVYNEYVKISASDELHQALIGEKIGVKLDKEIKVSLTEGDVTTEYTYTDVKIESMVKDNSTATVKDGDTVYVTYTITFDATPWFNEETNAYELPSGYLPTNVDTEGQYKETYTLDIKTVVADQPAEGETTVSDENKTFLGQLVGKSVGTTSTITVTNATIGEQTVEVKYTGVKVSWIVNSAMNGFTVEYTPYEEELKEDNSNKKTETSVKGEKVILNGEQLTYHIFPVYYLDVEEVSAELIMREFYSTVNSTQTKEHDETEEDHEHETEYVFDTLNDEEYKNGDKTLADLVGELVKLYTTLSDKEEDLTDALKALTTAQSNYASDDGDSESETASLKSKLDKAHTDYITAKDAADAAQDDVDAKIAAILECKKGETGIDESIVTDYETYHYDTLEDAYKADLTEKIAIEIIAYLNENIEYGDNLPKKAVKDAYNSIMNTYKYNFYEGNYSSSSSSSTSTSTETNYKHYNGDFDAYLIDKVTSNSGDMDDVKDSIMEEAEETVKGIILIYVFTDAVEAKWSDADVTLTKDEKKTIKTNLENTALLYQQYGLSFSYNVDDSYHAGQFDKVMNYLLEEKDTEGNEVEYENLVYSFDVAEEE